MAVAALPDWVSFLCAAEARPEGRPQQCLLGIKHLCLTRQAARKLTHRALRFPRCHWFTGRAGKTNHAPERDD